MIFAVYCAAFDNRIATKKPTDTRKKADTKNKVSKPLLDFSNLHFIPVMWC